MPEGAASRFDSVFLGRKTMKDFKRASPQEPPGERFFPLLGLRLNALRAQYGGTHLESDPLYFPHQYLQPADQEVVAFISASLAFGRVASIKKSISASLHPLNPTPASSLLSIEDSAPIVSPDFVHRWISAIDMDAFMHVIACVMKEYGSLGGLFRAGDTGSGDTFLGLVSFYAALRKTYACRYQEPLSRGLQFLFPSPERGGACKRAHLFLRWMIRQDSLDLGLWRTERLNPARLLLPMDTHVHRISGYLGLTSRPAADLVAVREVTSRLRELDPEDPVSYDWALARAGILGECRREVTKSHCERCAIEDVCKKSMAERPQQRKLG